MGRQTTLLFLRIPGLPDDDTQSTLIVNETEYALAKLPLLLSSSDANLRTKTLDAVRKSTNLSQADIAFIVTTLFTLQDTSTELEPTLIDFLINNIGHVEAINMGAQLTRVWASQGITNSLREKLTRELSSVIQKVRLRDHSTSGGKSAANRYILLRAFESPLLRTAAIQAIRLIFEDQDPNFVIERKVLSSQFLGLVRMYPPDPEITALKRLASSVFTGGTVIVTRTNQIHFRHTKNQDTDTAGDSMAQVQELLNKIALSNEPNVISRLLPKDFQILRNVKGLDLERFRVIFDKIRTRAVSDPWARAALLDLARAPHQPEVSARIRTAALGAFVNEARKYGKLTSQLEKEVFAISAEIPTLPFLQNEHNTREQENLPSDWG